MPSSQSRGRASIHISMIEACQAHSDPLDAELASGFRSQTTGRAFCCARPTPHNLAPRPSRATGGGRQARLRRRIICMSQLGTRQPSMLTRNFRCLARLAAAIARAPAPAQVLRAASAPQIGEGLGHRTSRTLERGADRARGAPGTRQWTSSEPGERLARTAGRGAARARRSVSRTIARHGCDWYPSSYRV